MKKVKAAKLKTLRFSSNFRPKSTKHIFTNKSPKESIPLYSKLYPSVVVSDKPVVSYDEICRKSFRTPGSPHITLRTPSKLRISTPLKQLNFVNKLLSKPYDSVDRKVEYSVGRFLTELKSQLTTHELSEILNYKSVFYWGNFEEKIHREQKKQGFDDEKGNLILYKGDHIKFQYEILKLLGHGSFGQVCECMDHKDNIKVAIKIIKNSKNLSRQAQTEIKLLNLVKEHDTHNENSIIHIKESFIFRDHICIVTELLGINLYEYHRSKGYSRVPSNTIRRIAIQILRSLDFLKGLKIIHTDLKPENILFKPTDNKEIKLIDFGSSCLENERVFTYIQSRFYRAPEVILGHNYSCSIDMWSFGCIIAELANGRPLFPANCERELLQMIMQAKGLVPNDLLASSLKKSKFFDKGNIIPDSNGNVLKPLSINFEELIEGDALFKDLIFQCLEWDPCRRITPESALKHPWILGDSNRTHLGNSTIFRILRKSKF